MARCRSEKSWKRWFNLPGIREELNHDEWKHIRILHLLTRHDRRFAKCCAKFAWSIREFSMNVLWERHQCSLKEEGDEEEDDPTSEVEEGEGGEDGQDDEFEDAWENYVLVGPLLWVVLDVLMFLIWKCASRKFRGFPLCTRIFWTGRGAGDVGILLNNMPCFVATNYHRHEESNLRAFPSWFHDTENDPFVAVGFEWCPRTVGFEKVCFIKRLPMLDHIGLWLMLTFWNTDFIMVWIISY